MTSSEQMAVLQQLVALDHSDQPPASPHKPADLPRALVLEHNAIMRERIRFELDRHQVEVTATSNPLEALEALHTGLFDLVVFDIEMPRLPAPQFVQILKKQRPSTALVALSAGWSRELRDRYLSYGANEVLAKPLQVSAFIGFLTATFHPSH